MSSPSQPNKSPIQHGPGWELAPDMRSFISFTTSSNSQETYTGGVRVTFLAEARAVAMGKAAACGLMKVSYLDGTRTLAPHRIGPPKTRTGYFGRLRIGISTLIEHPIIRLPMRRI